MTYPGVATAASGAAPEEPWRTQKIFVALALAVVLVAILTPQRGSGGSEFSTYSTGEMGARLIHDVLDRLGWDVDRRTAALSAPTPPNVVNALLGPRGGPAPEEVHLLLESVRAGGALLVAGGAGYLSDSLGFMAGEAARVVHDPEHCGTRAHRIASVFRVPAIGEPVRWRRPPPGEPVVFKEVVHVRRGADVRSPALVGIPLGKGRVVITASPVLVANDVLRQCDVALDVAFVRAMEYLRGSDGAPTKVVFDEYHHGYGIHPGTFRAIVHYATSTQSGHALLQAALAGLVLLMAMAPRPIAPASTERIARRSPLEHADALAHAYEAVGATRTVTARLLGGVRRRAGLSRAARSLDDDRFLSMVASSWPSVAAEADHVRRAIRSPMRSRELPAIARSIQKIEAVLSKPRNTTP